MPQPAPNEFSPSPKQLIFLFMAATVVAVVVFLFGLMVGRVCLLIERCQDRDL